MFKYAATLLIAPLMISASSNAMAQSFDHAAWDAIVQENVKIIGDGATSFDYANVQSKEDQLQAYLDQLSAIDQATFDTWSTDEQLAFLINAYNAFTVDLILTEYPNLVSIKDLGTALESPWQKEFVPLLGQTLSLDTIEHGMIRGSGRYNDPRIHFGVNCASIGCPALLNEAFVGGKLDQQFINLIRRRQVSIAEKVSVTPYATVRTPPGHGAVGERERQFRQRPVRTAEMQEAARIEERFAAVPPRRARQLDAGVWWSRDRPERQLG